MVKDINSKTIFLIILVLIFFCSVIINIAAAEQEEKIQKNVFIELFLNADCTHCPKAAFCLEELARGTPIELLARQFIFEGKIIVQGSLFNKGYSNLQNLTIGGMVYV